MGDRALIHFHNGTDMGPCIYLHWGGDFVPALLKLLVERMADRLGDVHYTTARAIGIAHENSPGNLSLGCWNAPGDSYDEARKAMGDNYSHGDAGVFLVDCRDWSVEHFGGYGFGDRGLSEKAQTYSRDHWFRIGAPKQATR